MRPRRLTCLLAAWVALLPPLVAICDSRCLTVEGQGSRAAIPSTAAAPACHEEGPRPAAHHDHGDDAPSSDDCSHPDRAPDSVLAARGRVLKLADVSTAAPLDLPGASIGPGTPPTAGPTRSLTPVPTPLQTRQTPVPLRI